MSVTNAVIKCRSWANDEAINVSVYIHLLCQANERPLLILMAAQQYKVIYRRSCGKWGRNTHNEETRSASTRYESGSENVDKLWRPLNGPRGDFIAIIVTAYKTSTPSGQKTSEGKGDCTAKKLVVLK